jgi:type IV secretion system protein VirB6
MAALCPAPGPDIPLVRSLLNVVDCNVGGLVRSGYGAFFEPNSTLSVLLTSMLTIYIAILGFQFMLGRTRLLIGEATLTVVKIGAILALTTQWSSYQILVYDFLFRGPAQLANVVMGGFQPQGSLFRGDVFDGLQSVFDALNAYAAMFAKNMPATAIQGAGSGAAGFGSQALSISAMILLLCTLGILLAAKVVLALLLAVGPIFIALILFSATRGLFEGWLRAAIAFAFGSLSVTLVLGFALTVLEPSLLRLRDNVDQGDYSLGPVYSILILVIVFAAVSGAALVASGIVATGLRLPRAREERRTEAAQVSFAATSEASYSASRAGRVSAAVSALDRREAAVFSSAAGTEGRRPSITISDRGSRPDRAAAGPAAEVRLGQGPRRGATPKQRRASARNSQ